MQQSGVQEISFGSVRIFWLDYPLIIEQLSRICEDFQNYPEILEVWLFGSFAQLRAVPGSDIDLLLVIEESKQRFIDRIEQYQGIFSDIGMSVDIFPYTRAEADTPVVRNAKKTGVCIYNASDEHAGRKALLDLATAAKLKRPRKV